MIQIRQSVFETNSSSVHTIAITRNNVPDGMVPNRVEIHSDDDYGWGIDTLYDTSSKIDYMYTVAKILDEHLEDVRRVQNGETQNRYGWKYSQYEINRYKSMKLPEIGSYRELFIEMLYSFGIEDVRVYGKEEGSIDHGDEWWGIANDFFENPDLMKSFLFSEESCVHLSNDNLYDDDEWHAPPNADCFWK